MNNFGIDKVFINRLSTSISKGKDLTNYWNQVAELKLFRDYSQYYRDNLKSCTAPKVKDLDKFIEKYTKYFTKKYPDVFKRIKFVKKYNPYFEESVIYLVELSNFSFSLIFISCIGGKHYEPFIKQDSRFKFKIYGKFEDFIDWVVKENELMTDFHAEWDNYCNEIRKDLMGNTLDDTVIKATIDEMLGDIKVDYSVTPIIDEKGRSIDIECKSLDVLFHIPGGYANWKKVVDVFVDIVKDRMSNK